MGVIQSAINQTIGTAGIVARLSPNFEKKAELRKIEKKERILQERLRMQKAMKKVANKQDAKQKQKRNFMSYLKEQPTNLGGTVGELPLNVQKQLAKQYSPAQRKQLMDTMDKERMNKNGK